jgi:hypothetical protein
MLEQATALVRWAHTRFEHLRLNLGVTVIVHRCTDSPEAIDVAVCTTAANRSEMRVVLMETITRSLIADGHTLESATGLAVEEYNVFGGKPS